MVARQHAAWGEQFSDQEITELANYVASLSGRERDPEPAAGKKTGGLLSVTVQMVKVTSS